MHVILEIYQDQFYFTYTWDANTDVSKRGSFWAFHVSGLCPNAINSWKYKPVHSVVALVV